MLLFIRASTTSLTGLSAVSIHLMLLFIQRHPEVGEAQQAFQYISCYSLSEKTFVKYFTRRLVSIHLMLLFIVIYSSRSKAKNVVSIHLMLLFIEAALFSEQGDDVFQYISCYSLSLQHYQTVLWCQCFNTSHVTLYQAFILCASLAGYCFNTSHVTLYLVLLMERLESAGCFNTSHVTLYHLVGMCSTELCCCFNTSHVTLYLITHKSKDGTHGRFNTSHVTLYRFLSSPRLVYCPGFNTSHVTLYPGARPDSQNLFCFNTSHVTLYPPSEHTEKIRPACFNTSHVTLYLCGLELFHPFRTFQYISCYSLSLFHILQLKCIPRFNTSHVTLYPIRNGCCSRPGTFQYISCYSLSLPISLI